MTTYSQINSLAEASFIAGSNFTFYYVFYDEDGVNRLNLGSASVYLVMCPYGQADYTVLQKEATITSAANGECNVELDPADTTGLSGKYIQQPVIVGATTTYRPAQGIVLILPEITVSGG